MSRLAQGDGGRRERGRERGREGERKRREGERPSVTHYNVPPTCTRAPQLREREREGGRDPV
jgi:hypothetical protein